MEPRSHQVTADRLETLATLVWPGVADPIGFVRTGPRREDLLVWVDRIDVERQGLNLDEVVWQVQLDLVQHAFCHTGNVRALIDRDESGSCAVTLIPADAAPPGSQEMRGAPPGWVPSRGGPASF